MENIYLPVDNFNDYACYYVYDKNTIRALQQSPQVGNNNYTDFYINSHYLEKQGTQVITETIEMPLCFSKDIINTNIYYRNDISHILVIVFILILILVVLPYLIFRRFFGKWLKI